ncbi:hypothetical protein H1D32_02200 [Anaerobacillus sp. CMMVII]|uniref:hypothetical protein n=1 Tax=Anaerobacillus sp. CMMVII TaxID=2755588 RepID=UPI0021B72D70|nr:hypothetical protein [Anaerobacillus sp. CMMVII]MCT8136663.1 hypothetical protein [Anaerobacillus sp. CMMVII]
MVTIKNKNLIGLFATLFACIALFIYINKDNPLKIDKELFNESFEVFKTIEKAKKTERNLTHDEKVAIMLYEKKWMGEINSIKRRAFKEGDRTLTANEFERIREIESVFVDTIKLTKTFALLIEQQDEFSEKQYLNDFKVTKAALGIN